MQHHVSGPFEVTMTPAAPEQKEGVTSFGRMALDKRYSGALAATGKGEMLTAVTDTKGSAAYVAIERISGTLDGRSGEFVIQHAGMMARGAEQLAMTIVADSGTRQLAGIRGTMLIKRGGGKHVYELRYELPSAD